ncbi:hypothetical protein BM1_04745 [Bipolaris maydis]|nr:hypothetical protein BM1_04745 [Bipolaris maydis]
MFPKSAKGQLPFDITIAVGSGLSGTKQSEKCQAITIADPKERIQEYIDRYQKDKTYTARYNNP